MAITIKNLNSNEKSWTFLDGSERTAVILESVFIGRGTYLSGWKWSEHVGKQTGKDSAANIGYFISVKGFKKGTNEKDMSFGRGDVFEIEQNNEGWVVEKSVDLGGRRII